MPEQTFCKHLQALDVAYLKRDTQHECPECVALGDTWVHLRVCQACGHMGCCDSSKNQHATRHYETTRHPVVISAERGEHWAFCYPDQQLAGY